MNLACPNGHDLKERRHITVRCETPGCTARIVYEPVAVGMGLAGQLRVAHETLKRAVGCTGADGCLGPLSLPKCEPCLAFALEHLFDTSPNPVE
jgi:hypothetical protein